MTIAASESRKSFWRRHCRKSLGLIVVVAVCVGIDAFVGSMFRSQIADAVKEGIGADLTCGSAWYLPKRGVSLHNVRLLKTTADGRTTELFRASRLVLKLERNPAEKQPNAGAGGYRLRYAKMTGGHISYSPKGGEPLILDGLDLELSPTNGSPQLYHFFADADAKDASPIRGAGSIDMDDRMISVAGLSLRLKINAALSRFPMSDSARRKLDECKIGGALDIRGSASVPLNDWTEAEYKTVVQLSSGNFVSSGGKMKVDRINGELAVVGDRANGTKIEIHRLEAMNGATMLALDGGKFKTEPHTAAWTLTEVLGRLEMGGGIAALDRVDLRGRIKFTGSASGPIQMPKDATLLSVVKHEFVAYPVDVSIRPAIYPLPVDHINGGPIRFQAGVVRLENLNANYGGDKVVLGEAHITLDDPRQKLALDDLRRQIRVDGVIGSLLCRQPGPMYPAGLGKVIAQLRPSGAFAIAGWYGINRKLPGEVAKPKADYFFRVSTAGGAFALTGHKAPLTDINADAAVSPMLVDITRLRGKMFGGDLIAVTKVTPVHPVRYEGTATFYNVNLAKAWQELDGSEKSPLTGVAYFKTRVSGIGPGANIAPLRSIAADGEFEIVNGNFGDITAIRAAAKSVSRPDQSLDGRAAGVFSLRDEKVTLSNFAVGNLLYGLEGSGTIGFDKTLDFHVVAAPLGEWQTTLKQANVPMLANVAAPIERLFNGAQHALLYDVHVTGPATHPTVEAPTPIPVITKPIAALFGQMIGGRKDASLIDQLRTRDGAADKNAQPQH